MLTLRLHRQVVALAVGADSPLLSHLHHELQPVRRLSVPIDRNEAVNGVPKNGDESKLTFRVEYGQRRSHRDGIPSQRASADHLRSVATKASNPAAHKAVPLHVVKSEMAAPPVVLVRVNELSLRRRQALELVVRSAEKLPKRRARCFPVVDEEDRAGETGWCAKVKDRLHVPRNIVISVCGRREGNQNQEDDHHQNLVFYIAR